MAHYRAQPKEVETALAALVGVKAEELDRNFDVVVGEGVREPGE
ncbi:hypothetical protein [Streptomyces sp. NPDC005930]